MEAHFEKVFEHTKEEKRLTASSSAAARYSSSIKHDDANRRHPSDAQTTTPVKIKRPKTEVLHMPDIDENDNGEFTLNPRVVKQMISSLEKKLQKNEMMRAKHADDPSKFMVDVLQNTASMHRLSLSRGYRSYMLQYIHDDRI
jgi:hypothetical protein